jgi:hypothetical protein
MLTEKFDAYGGVLPDAARGKREAARNASALLTRVGQSIFWLLVIIIVSARIIYYPATPALEADSASAPKHAVTH